MLDRDLISVIQLGFGFLVILSAFNGQGFIEVAVLRSFSENAGSGISANSGYYSMAIIYSFMTISNFAVPTVISRIGAKWSMTVGALFYVFFMLGFLYLSAFLLYALSALLGIGAALLWTASGVFLVEFSVDGKLNRNSGILWLMIQGSLIPGATFLTFLLQNENMEDSYRLLYLVFSALAIFAVFTFFLLPQAPRHKASKIASTTDMRKFWKDILRRSTTNQDTEEPRKSIIEDFKDIGKLMRSRKMATLLVMFLYLGIETSFANGVFTGCLSATRKLSESNEAVIAYAIFSLALGHIIGAALFGMFAPAKAKFGLRWVMGVGLGSHLMAYTLCFLFLPFYSPLGNTWEEGVIEPSLMLVLLTGFLLGFGGSCWHTQSLVLIGDLYNGPSLGAAFAIYRSCQSLAGSIVFTYSAYLELHWQLGIASLFGILGYFTYSIVHQWATRETEMVNMEVIERSVIHEEILEQ